MTEPFAFTCACCGKEVLGLPAFGFASPDYYDNLSEAERASRAKISSDLCVVDDEHYFIRAVCPVPIQRSEETFDWGVWVTLSEKNYQRYVETFDDADQSELGGMFGWFSNKLPGYPDTLSLETTVVPQDGNQRPLVWINETNADHPLYVDQREGITSVRVGEIYANELCDVQRSV